MARCVRACCSCCTHYCCSSEMEFPHKSFPTKRVWCRLVDQGHTLFFSLQKQLENASQQLLPTRIPRLRLPFPIVVVKT